MHSYQLLDLGVTVLMRETFLSSLELARDVLVGLGQTTAEADEIAPFPRARRGIARQATAVRHDEEQLIATARKPAMSSNACSSRIARPSNRRTTMTRIIGIAGSLRQAPTTPRCCAMPWNWRRPCSLEIATIKDIRCTTATLKPERDSAASWHSKISSPLRRPVAGNRNTTTRFGVFKNASTG